MKEETAIPPMLHKELNDYNVSSRVRKHFSLTKEEKLEKIAWHFKEIMLALGLDIQEDGLKDTPRRVAKMYVEEIFSGLDDSLRPRIAMFENKYKYSEIMIEKNIELYSICEHHFVPIVGKVHVAYIPEDKVIGLSKINRLVRFYAKRPQIQERLTIQIADGLKEVLSTENVAVLIEAVHFCVAARGIKDVSSGTITSSYSGAFLDSKTQDKFFALLKL